MEVVFTFSNTNYAIQAERTLLSANLKVKVMPLPSAIRAGCGLCLRLHEKDSKKAQNILENINIPAEQIFIRTSENAKSKFKIFGGFDDD
jgi:hypothetical protein